MYRSEYCRDDQIVRVAFEGSVSHDSQVDFAKETIADREKETA